MEEYTVGTDEIGHWFRNHLRASPTNISTQETKASLEMLPLTCVHISWKDEIISSREICFFQVTHTVSNGGVYNAKVFATATELTPIMLTQHIYWSETFR